MKIAIALMCLIAAPLAAEAQTQIFLNDSERKRDAENFTASVDLRGQHFVHSTIPNRILDDHTGYHHVPGQQMDVFVRSNLAWNFSLDVEVYAWIGENQWLSRIGLIGELKYETPLDWISVGYGHHSWHNVDVNDALHVGHQQDWAMVRFDLPKITFDEKSFVRFSLQPEYFISSKSPIMIRDVYGLDEDYPWSMLAMPIVGTIYDFSFELKPYVQFSHQNRRYGVSAELVYNFTDFFAGFVSGEYIETAGRHQEQIGIGVMLRLKR